jgi:hypothetical protein
MDILAHGVYNLALQKNIKKKSKKINTWEAISWGILPDLIPFGIPLLFGLFSGNSFNHHSVVGGFDIARVLYPFTHSLVIFFGVFLVMYVIKKKWYLPMLGWGLHVLMDIPLHTPEYFPTPFLFPISDWTLPFGIAWSTPYIWISLWIFVLIWLFLSYRRKKQL